MPHLTLENARAPLVIAIDFGTSSVRAVVFDANGHQIRGLEHKERHRPTLTADGGSTVDPQRMLTRMIKCLRRCTEKLGGRAVDVELVGVSCFWHSLLGLDASGQPITPVYMWNDKRASADAIDLADEVDVNAVHQRTGCPVHSSFWPAKLHWLRRTQPEVFAKVITWCSLTDWLLRPTDAELSTSVSMASATGMLNTHAGEWDVDMLALTGVAPHQLPAIAGSTRPYTPNLPLPAGLTARWYPAIGDGAAANIGAGAIGADRIALTIGTSGAIRMVRPSHAAELPPSLWRYLIDTETEVIGGALSNGGNMLAWLASLSQSQDPATLMAQAARIPPDAHGLTVLPFFAGERAPSWQDSLAGAIVGLKLDTSAVEIHRALLEATGLRFSVVYDALRAFAAPQHQIIASGGALLQSPVWCQIVADTLGHRLAALQSRTEASARGVAITALHAAGYRESLRSEPVITKTYRPDRAATETYRAARARLESLEHALHSWRNQQS